MLIDVHAHFYHDRTPRADWRERNASRLSAGAKIGITIHVASILGSWGRTSPTYFPSPADLPYGNDALLALQREHPDGIRGYVTVNPNYTAHARGEIVRCLRAGMIGIKLAASRRANDPLLDPICELAAEHGAPAGVSWAISSTCSLRPSSIWCAGRTRPASSLPARSRPTDADRRQRLPRCLPVPPRARHRPRRGAPGDGARWDRRSLGDPPPRPVLASAAGGKRLAVRDDGSRAAAQAGARGAPRPGGMGGRDGGGRRPRRPRGAVRPDLLRARPRWRGDARTDRRVRRRGRAARDGRAPRGRPPTAPQRSGCRAPRGGGAGADPERRRRSPGPHPCRPRVRRRGALRLDARGSGAHLVGHLLHLGPARGPPRDAARHRRGRPVRVRA